MPRTINNFTEVIGLLSRGRFSEKLNEELRHALEALEALPNEKGTATMVLTLTIAYQAGRIDIKPSVKCKLPEGQSFSETPFWTLDGGLSVQHPSQADMFPAREVKPAQEPAAS